MTEIAERAGLTERTFFRYFADKREVLFGGQDKRREIYVSTIEAAPDPAAPIDAVAAALEAAVPVFQERHKLVRQRQTVIAANPKLQERELQKRTALASDMADALRSRGVTDLAASLAAEIGVISFSTAFARWVSAPEEQDLVATHPRVPRPTQGHHCRRIINQLEPAFLFREMRGLNAVFGTEFLNGD